MTDIPKPGLTRRRFLTASLTTGCGCLLAPLILPTRARAEFEASYYLIRSQGLFSDFKKLNQAAEKYLAKDLGQKTAQAICAAAPTQFSRLIPKLPFIGGRGNMDTMYLILSAFVLAYKKPFDRHGLQDQDLGRMYYELQKQDLAQMPRQRAEAIGAFRFSKIAQETMRQWCAWTQKRQFAGNWVAEYIAGNGKDFDFGYDVTKCAVVDFYRANGASGLAPYFCVADFLRSKVFGTGLRRSQTIAQGDALCNFRYKKGRPVTQGWRYSSR